MALPFIAPPTDNLYKFMAVFGLVLMIAGAVLCYQTAENHHTRITKIYLEEDTADHEFLELEEQAVNLAARPYQDGKRTAEELTKELRRLLVELQEMRKAVETPEKLAAKLQRAREYQHVNESFTLLMSAAVIGTVFGFLLSIFGFFLWYVKVQVHLDSEIRKKARTKHIPFKARV